MERECLRFEERLDRVVDGFLQQAWQRPSSREIADKTTFSVAQTHRLFKKAYGESPGAFRRRLVLERAAELLKTTDKSVWQVATESGFSSAEAFARAFRRAYRSTPREMQGGNGAHAHWLPAPSTVHYWRGSLLRSMDPGGKKMNIVDRLIEHDLSDTRRLLERAQTLTKAQLDAKLPDPKPRLFLECFDATIRGRLDYLIATKEAWLAAVFAQENPLNGKRDKTPAGMIARFEHVKKQWRELVKNVEEEGRWNEQFIDALCEQPCTFSFGGMIAHVLDQSARNRTEAFRAFAALGHEDVCDGDPLTWEQKQAS